MKQMLSLPVDVVIHLQKQDNMSAYVTRLIRQDKAESFEDRVRRIVSRMLSYTAPAPAMADDINSSIKSILNL